MGYKQMVIIGMLIAGFLAPQAMAAESKIGIIDFQRVLEASDSGKAAQEEINKQGEKMESDLKERSDEIEALETKLERESMVMDSGIREEKKREVRIKINDIRTLQKKYIADFKKMEAQIINKIQKDVFEIVAEMGKQNGYTLILEKRAGGVVFSADAQDVTDEVIKQYNTFFEKQKASQ